MNTITQRISIFRKGEKENKPIIFIHGFPYDHKMWDEQLEYFSQKYYCISYDIRGLGVSEPGDGQFTMETFVDDLENIIDEFHLNKPIVCGLSMGGYIALRAVERMEHKLGGIILCDTKPAADDNAGKLKRAEGVKKINSHGVAAFTSSFIPNCFSQSSIKDLGELYQDILNRSAGFTAAGVKGCLLAMAGRTDTSDYLSEIRIPSLLICGEEDNLTPPKVMKDAAAKIANSEFEIIHKSGHMTPVENPGAFNNAVENFLNKHFG